MNKLVQSAGHVNTLLQRVLNAMALCLIALAVFAQGLLVLMESGGGGTGGTLNSIFDALRPAILPGIFLAFLKFVLNVIRSFKSGQARVKALVYFLITTSPLTVSLSGAHLAQGSQIGGKAPESEQFLLGRDWGRARQPVHDGECSGASEFVRGCRSAIKERRDQQLQSGYEWARENRPLKASACQGRPYFVLGCRRYFHENLAVPKPAGQGKYEGMTTEECKTEVNANYEAAEQLDIENGNSRGAAVRRYRSWVPELQDCENYDRHAQQAAGAASQESPYERLTRLVTGLKAQEMPTPEDQAAVEADVIEVSGGSESGYRRAYFLLHDEYMQRLAGEYKEGGGPDSHLSCAAFQEKINEMQRLENDRVSELATLTREDGRITNGTRHAELHRQRLDMLWDWKRYTDGAKAANCDTRTN